jgi:hypothetical protein
VAQYHDFVHRDGDLYKESWGAIGIFGIFNRENLLDCNMGVTNNQHEWRDILATATRSTLDKLRRIDEIIIWYFEDGKGYFIPLERIEELAESHEKRRNGE